MTLPPTRWSSCAIPRPSRLSLAAEGRTPAPARVLQDAVRTLTQACFVSCTVVSNLREVSGAPQDLWRTAVARDPARPFLTHYDDATGERVELSFTTTDNWVAKTANLLVDELCAEPGERIGLWLPTHWQTVVWYLACWATGTVPTLEADAADCAHAVADPEHAGATMDCPGTRLLLALRPLGGRAATVPTGMLDYAAEVPTHGDRFAGPPVLATAPALERAGVSPGRGGPGRRGPRLVRPSTGCRGPRGCCSPATSAARQVWRPDCSDRWRPGPRWCCAATSTARAWPTGCGPSASPINWADSRRENGRAGEPAAAVSPAR